MAVYPWSMIFAPRHSRASLNRKATPSKRTGVAIVGNGSLYNGDVTAIRTPVDTASARGYEMHGCNRALKIDSAIIKSSICVNGSKKTSSPETEDGGFECEKVGQFQTENFGRM